MCVLWFRLESLSITDLFHFIFPSHSKEELEKKIKEPQVAPVVEEEELPPGQIRDEKGVIWQVCVRERRENVCCCCSTLFLLQSLVCACLSYVSDCI